jgi:hypothetical protein
MEMKLEVIAVAVAVSRGGKERRPTSGIIASYN